MQWAIGCSEFEEKISVESKLVHDSTKLRLDEFLNLLQGVIERKRGHPTNHREGDTAIDAEPNVALEFRVR